MSEQKLGALFYDVEIRWNQAEQQARQLGGKLQAAMGRMSPSEASVGGGLSNVSPGANAALRPLRELPSMPVSPGAMEAVNWQRRSRGLLTPGGDLSSRAIDAVDQIQMERYGGASVRSPMRGGFGPQQYGPGAVPMPNQIYGAPIGPPAPPGFGGGGGGAGGGGAFGRFGKIMNTKLFSTGAYMNAFFGGWEVATAANADAKADRFEAAHPGDLVGQLKARNAAVDRITAGPMGSMLSLGLGVERYRETVDNIAGSAADANAMVDAKKNTSSMFENYQNRRDLANARDTLTKSLLETSVEYQKERGVIKEDYQTRKEMLRSRRVKAIGDIEHAEADLNASAGYGGGGGAMFGAGMNYAANAERVERKRAGIQTAWTEYNRGLEKLDAEFQGPLDSGRLYTKEVSDIAKAERNELTKKRINSLSNAAKTDYFNRVASKGYGSIEDQLGLRRGERGAMANGLPFNEAADMDILGSAEDRAITAQNARGGRLDLMGSFGGMKASMLGALGFDRKAAMAAMQAENAVDFEKQESWQGRLGATMRGFGRGFSTVGDEISDDAKKRKKLEDDQFDVEKDRDKLLGMQFGNGRAITSSSQFGVNFQGGTTSPETPFKNALKDTEDQLRNIATALQNL